MGKQVLLTNVYKVALLNNAGFHGDLVMDRGYIQFSFEENPELLRILNEFDSLQIINLRCYVDHLRRAQDQIRNAKLERRRYEHGESTTHRL